MKIITPDGKEWIVKYMQNKEAISNNLGVTVQNFPGFKGSKLHQNSSSSDIYKINFALHESQIVEFKDSLKKFVTDEKQAVNHDFYGKLLRIIIEHDRWGAIQGNIISDVDYNTSVLGDIPVSFTFQEHTAEEPLPQRDFATENENAESDVDFETTENFDEELDEDDRSAIAKFIDSLQDLYANIQNSDVISAFNDAKSAINSAIMDSKKIMNSIKKILALPGKILTDISSTLNLLVEQANEIKNLPSETINMAKFNINCFSYNITQTAKTAFSAPTPISGVRVNALG